MCVRTRQYGRTVWASVESKLLNVWVKQNRTYTRGLQYIHNLSDFDFFTHTHKEGSVPWVLSLFTSRVLSAFFFTFFPFLSSASFYLEFYDEFSPSFPTWSPCFYLQSFPSWHISFIYSKHKPRDCNKKRYFISYPSGKHYLLMYSISHIQRNKTTLTQKSCIIILRDICNGIAQSRSV